MIVRLNLSEMSKSKTSELEDYVRRLGEHINLMYSKLNEIEKKLEESEDKMKDTENSFERLLTGIANNTDAISNLRENSVQKLEFEEFVGRLTESLRNLLPPIPEVAEEEQKSL